MQTILVAEDNPLVVSFLQTSLEKYGFEVKATDNGQDAIALAQTKHFDLVLLDYDIPAIDGLTVCRMIANQQTVFFYSAGDIANEALAAGATKFLTKQCPERALTAIKEYLFLSHMQEQ